jgi:hypothetical protein
MIGFDANALEESHRVLKKNLSSLIIKELNEQFKLKSFKKIFANTFLFVGLKNSGWLRSYANAFSKSNIF